MGSGRLEGYSLGEIERGWQEYLSKPPEVRDTLQDPFNYSDRDLHLNQCLRVIPNQFKEEAKFASPPRDEEQIGGDYELKLKLFMARGMPRYPTMKNESTWICK